MKLQQGLEKKTLNMRGLLKLFIYQLLETAMDRITNEIMLTSPNSLIDARINVTTGLNARLQQKLEVGLLTGYLELDSSEMKDNNIRLYFQDARKLVEGQAITIFTKQLQFFREYTSIIARIAALASLTSRNSWTILSLTATVPLLDHVLAMIPWRSKFPNRKSSLLWQLILAWSTGLTYEESTLGSKMLALRQLALSPSSRPEVSIFGAKDWIIKHYTKLSDLLMNLKESGRLSARQDVPIFQRHIIPLVHSSARALMYLTVAYQPDYYGIPISQLAFLESSVEEIFRSISSLRFSVSTGPMVDMFRIRNLFECIEMKSKVSKPINPVPYISNPRGMKIELRNVSFRYKDDSPHILKDVNFTVEPGQIVSIVGYNGSGDPCCPKSG